MKISKPLNLVQRTFNELCSKGGGVGGGPARTKVQALLHDGSKKLNKFAFDEVTDQLKKFSDRDPWHVCFAVGLGWGHLAQISDGFTDCPSSGNLRLIRRFEKRGSGSSGLEFKRPAVDAASDGLRWWRV